jgi:hypothetical protein
MFSLNISAHDYFRENYDYIKDLASISVGVTSSKNQG